MIREHLAYWCPLASVIGDYPAFSRVGGAPGHTFLSCRMRLMAHAPFPGVVKRAVCVDNRGL